MGSRNRGKLLVALLAQERESWKGNVFRGQDVVGFRSRAPGPQTHPAEERTYPEQSVGMQESRILTFLLTGCTIHDSYLCFLHLGVCNPKRDMKRTFGLCEWPEGMSLKHMPEISYEHVSINDSWINGTRLCQHFLPNLLVLVIIIIDLWLHPFLWPG